jgi:hypothetical protein|tara:strand:+ start:1020 stop:1274 length:255 start_codon:yes stop_codon:yes gene_type:complete
MLTIKEFIKYCLDFYGKGGIHNLNYTKKQIATGVDAYFKNMNDDINWGGGDTIDRERVRFEMQKLFPDVENLKNKKFDITIIVA